MASPQEFIASIFDDVQATYPRFDKNKYPMSLLLADPTIETSQDSQMIITRVAHKFLIHAMFVELGDEDWSENLASQHLAEIQASGFLRFFANHIYSREILETRISFCWDIVDLVSAERNAFPVLTAPNGDLFRSATSNLERLARRTKILDYARIVDAHLGIHYLTSEAPNLHFLANKGPPIDTAQEILESRTVQLTSRERDALKRFLYNKARNQGILPTKFYVKHVKKLEEHPIGGGNYGDVYKGQLGEQCVAVKVSRYLWDPEMKEKSHRDICKEALIWKPLDHLNVLPFLGICTVGFPSIGLVSPFMKNGDLLSYIRRNPTISKVEIMQHICSGLEYLHGNKPEVVHGDLKCGNILVDETGNPRIADFGLARLSDVATKTATTGIRGTLRWQAPELVHPSMYYGDGRLNTKTDVYAFGMTCLEIFTQKSPFQDLSDWEVITMARNGAALESALEITKGCDWMALILQYCCHAEAEYRFQARDVTTDVFWSPLVRNHQ